MKKSVLCLSVCLMVWACKKEVSSDSKEPPAKDYLEFFSKEENDALNIVVTLPTIKF